MIRLIETSMQVRRRYQFFVWSQTYLAPLLPHQVSVCGAYQRSTKTLLLEAFNSVSVPTFALATVCDSGSLLVQQVIGAWTAQNGQAVIVDLAKLGGSAVVRQRDSLIAEGFERLLVHGVARPSRPSEVESLFMFMSHGQRWDERLRSCLDMTLPFLHATYLRVQATERELGSVHAGGAPLTRAEMQPALITARERQILSWVREGKSNLEIGVVLAISSLTVKNHVQKILRKLGAANRAQAVAKAMSLNLLSSNSPPEPEKRPSSL